MEREVAPLAALYDLNADLLLNCLDDLTDAEAQQRPEAGGNSVAFLASHLVDSRHFLVTRLGQPLTFVVSRRSEICRRWRRSAPPGLKSAFTSTRSWTASLPTS
jgi:hypothetical protein